MTDQSCEYLFSLELDKQQACDILFVGKGCRIENNSSPTSNSKYFWTLLRKQYSIFSLDMETLFCI